MLRSSDSLYIIYSCGSLSFIQETFKIRDSETIEYPECQETNKTECVYLKKNYNSIDLTEVEQIDEYVEESNETIKEQFRPRIGNLLTQVCAHCTYINVLRKYNIDYIQ